MKLYSKHPDAKLDFSIDWTEFLGADDIDTSSWTAEEIDGDGAPLVLSDNGESSGVSVIWIEGGTEGFAYLVSNHIVTTAGREDTRSFVLRIEKK